MIINFTKMHALGNDFVIIDAITQEIKLPVKYIKKLADRYTGIGFDQIIILEPPIQASSDFYYKVYNPNGKMAEQCLNGVRCAAKFAVSSGLINKKIIVADCISGNVMLTIENDKSVTAHLNMLKTDIETISIELSDQNDSITYQIHRLSIGNPHAIIFINNKKSEQQTDKITNLNHYKYSSLAKELAKQSFFAEGINIGFAKIVNKDIKLRVFERGVGETLSCGTNAVAAFLVAKHLKLIANQALVLFKLGALQINMENNSLAINGPVNSIFNGKFKI